MLEGDDAASAAVYSCGPPAMLEAVRALCAERGVACELAMESPMACGFGACFGCAVPHAGGGYMRLCVDGPVVARRRGSPRSARCLSFCGIELAHPVINASGTFDAIAARRAFGDELLERIPVLRLRLEDDHAGAAGRATRRSGSGRRPAGMINSIGLPNKGLEGFLAEDLPQLAELPVPLIVSVMATSHEEFARLVDGVGGARRGRGDRAQRLLPQRRTPA